MSDLNSVVIVGNLTRDPELKKINDSDVVNFSIATNRKYKEKKETSFFDCELWGKPAEVFNKYMTKGQRVGIRGRLRQSSWKTPEGETRSRVTITVEDFQFLSYKKDDETPATATDTPDDDFTF